MNASQIAGLLERGESWTGVFAAILDKGPANERGRMVLFRELQRLCEVDVQTLSIIGGWNYWPDGPYDDWTLNSMLEGKIRFRPIHSESGPHR